MGVGVANGVSTQEAEQVRRDYQQALHDSEARNSCYWSFCGGSCVAGYFPQTSAKGQVPSIQRDLVCRGDQVQTLCCAPGTQMGTCAWEGWRGVGLACDFGCSEDDATMVAANSE
jgi:chitinase